MLLQVISVHSPRLVTNLLSFVNAPFFFIISACSFAVIMGFPALFGIQAKTVPSVTPFNPDTGSAYSLAQPHPESPKQLLHVL
jgi:hypothetical protein